MSEENKKIVDILAKYGHQLGSGMNDTAYLWKDGDEETIVYNLGKISKECHEEILNIYKNQIT